MEDLDQQAGGTGTMLAEPGFRLVRAHSNRKRKVFSFARDSAMPHTTAIIHESVGLTRKAIGEHEHLITSARPADRQEIGAADSLRSKDPALVLPTSGCRDHTAHRLPE